MLLLLCCCCVAADDDDAYPPLRCVKNQKQPNRCMRYRRPRTILTIFKTCMLAPVLSSRSSMTCAEQRERESERGKKVRVCWVVRLR